MLLKHIDVFKCLGGDIIDYLSTNTCMWNGDSRRDSMHHKHLGIFISPQKIETAWLIARVTKYKDDPHKAQDCPHPVSQNMQSTTKTNC